MLKSLGKKIVSIVFGFNLPDECVYVSVSYRLLNGNAYSTQLYKSIPFLVQMTNALLKGYNIFNQSPTAGHFSVF